MPAVNKKDNKKTSDAPVKEAISVRFDIISESAPERVYANHVQVSATPYDFTLEFCDIQAITIDEAKKAGDDYRMKVVPKVRIALTKEVFHSLAGVLRHVSEQSKPEKSGTE